MVQEVQNQDDTDYDSAEFEDGDFVPACCHASQAAGGASEGGGEGGECLALYVTSASSSNVYMFDAKVQAWISSYNVVYGAEKGAAMGGREGAVGLWRLPYRRVNNTLVPRIVVDVYCDTPQCRYFRAELVKA